MLLAGLTGFVAGFIVSIPLGPTNVTIINEGAQRGFIWGLLIGAGAVAMETIYCWLAFAGFSNLIEGALMRATLELASFILMAYLGVKYLLVRDLPATTPTLEKIEDRFHPHTAFMTGFVRVLGNPGVLLFWIATSATLISHQWIDDTQLSKTFCVSGVSLGAMAWFGLVSFVVSRGKGRFSRTTLLRMSHVSGACLLLAAVLIGARLVKLLAGR